MQNFDQKSGTHVGYQGIRHNKSSENVICIPKTETLYD